MKENAENLQHTIDQLGHDRREKELGASVQHEISSSEINELRDEVRLLHEQLIDSSKNSVELQSLRSLLADKQLELADAKEKLMQKSEELIATARQLEDANADCEKPASMHEKAMMEVEQVQAEVNLAHSEIQTLRQQNQFTETEQSKALQDITT